MKQIIFLTFAILLHGTLVFGQHGKVQVDSTTSYVIRHHQEHCGATRTGNGLMIAGAGIAGIGGILALENTGSSDHQASAQGDLVGGVVAGLGVSIAFYGLISYMAGMSYESRHRDQFSVFCKPHQLGIAYNF